MYYCAMRTLSLILSFRIIVCEISVVRFEGLAEFYIQLTKQGVRDKVPSGRYNLCKLILHSIFFQRRRETFFDTREPLALSRLEEHYPELVDFVFEMSPVLVAPGFAGQIKEKMIETYPVMKRHVQVKDDRIEENLFSCLARDQKTLNIKVYLISGNYKVNDKEEAKNYPISFIFTYDLRRQIQLLALIEREAVAYDDYEKTIKYYTTMRTHYPPLAHDSEDPICGLSNGAKLRICTAILSSGKYSEDSGFRYWPNKYNVTYNCVRAPLSVRLPAETANETETENRNQRPQRDIANETDNMNQRPPPETPTENTNQQPQQEIANETDNINQRPPPETPTGTENANQEVVVDIEMQPVDTEVQPVFEYNERVFSCKAKHIYSRRTITLYVMPNLYSLTLSAFTIRFYDGKFLLDDHIGHIGALLGYSQRKKPPPAKKTKTKRRRCCNLNLACNFCFGNKDKKQEGEEGGT